jgi:hypothetical protein
MGVLTNGVKNSILIGNVRIGGTRRNRPLLLQGSNMIGQDLSGWPANPKITQ